MKRKLVKSEFGKNVLVLMRGSTIAQFLPVALTPVLTRIFSPEEFGIYALYMSMITFLAVISTGRYEQAVVLPKENREAVNILILSILIVLCFALFLYLVLFIFGSLISEKLNEPSLNSWMWLLPLCVMFTGIYRVLSFWSNRHKRFKGTSNSLMSNSVIRMAVQVVGGLKKFGVWRNETSIGDFFRGLFKKGRPNPEGITADGVGTLVLSYFAGMVAAVIILIFPFYVRDRKLLREVSRSEMIVQAKRYDKFPKINIFHALSDELKNIGVNVTILYFFSDKVLGFFSITTRILRGPLNVIGNSFGQVFFQKAAEMHAHGQDIIPFIKNTVKKMFIVALPIFAVILFFGPDLFDLVLGHKWRIAGVYAQYLTPWLFLNFIIAPVLQVAVIKNKQGENFIISLIHNLIILGSIAVGGVGFDDLLVGFAILSSLQVVFYLLVLKWILKISAGHSVGNEDEESGYNKV